MTDFAEEFPPPSNPMAVARQLVEHWQCGGVLVLRHWCGTWMRWEDMHWREMDDQELRAWLYKQMEHATYEAVTPKGETEVRDWAPTIPKVANLTQAMTAVTHLSPRVDAPAWLTDGGDGGGRPVDGPVVACTNGLLRVSNRSLTPLTPRFFNLVSVPFDYDPAATAPNWREFLAKIWADDRESVDALQEWFGYILSGRTDQQKILLIVGPTRSGKGTITRVLETLVGEGNKAGPTLASLATNFGLSPLLGKSLALISDARLSGRDGQQVVERLLTISGQDTIDVDRKFRIPWTGKLPTRIMISSNELPNFGDSSGVIANRFIVLRTTASWLGREDSALGDKLNAEMPGILNWALDGLDRLERTGRLTEPAASRDEVTVMQDTASPTSAFLRERCTTGPNESVPVDALWAAWKDWAEDSGVPPGTKAVFGRNLLSVVPQLHRIRPRGADGRQIPTYTGLSLTAADADQAPSPRPAPRPAAEWPPVAVPGRPTPPQQTALYAGCGEPFQPIEPCQTTHPTCEPARLPA
ncbi:DNA primase family protein [Streptomyces benahoarensis]|uniref:NTP-binding protein n=1 Tax=Streptomyces benahoarensis TaxID=2595054 RepID=A0A553Z799_9ACTN|nr:DNA primase family protein [Streptomyces benahoarensis]TSB24022.1 NTP-binding protein [Streptomyces benahoarensis]TSB37290.1 NTP-binding protein [Streptomyces benahoarensis]